MPRPTRMYHHGGTLLRRARDFVHEHRHDAGGCICPACGSHRHVKDYPMTPVLAEMMRRLVSAAGPSRRLVHKDEFNLPSNNMYSILRQWGLIEQESRKSGMWRPSALGRRWVMGQSSVPASVFVDMAVVLGVSDRRLTFSEALQEPEIDVQQVMSADTHHLLEG